MKHKHYLPGSFVDSSDKHILLVGVGGTGSQILTDLARMNQTLIQIGHRGFSVDVVDPDVVSETNVGRQLYSMSDVGHYKSPVLTTRLNMFFGTAWRAYVQTIKRQTSLPASKYILIITAVDNVAARLVVADKIEAAGIPYWLDTGNMAKTGNVILGSAKHLFSRQPWKKCVERLPNAVELYGDVLKSAANEAIQPPSCSMEASLLKQDLFINKAVSTFAMQILWNCFSRGYIEQHGAFINLDTMTVRPLDVDPDKWKAMGWQQQKVRRKKYN
ncbi:MAG TPA: PRTRC system ThiF family protein [Smithellaceae bacterium]|nr:MAG: thiamine biosynthesis protein ThiF [Firmicutes bacterium ADurb.Bin193]HNQ63119.1 PRTRC system ThiF family protein [Syntrophorhabdaceae bacterium]HNS55606.1 PRTRC system ThiF family protein [Smithellaceae bacterium]